MFLNIVKYSSLTIGLLLFLFLAAVVFHMVNHPVPISDKVAVLCLLGFMMGTASFVGIDKYQEKWNSTEKKRQQRIDIWVCCTLVFMISTLTLIVLIVM
jgi:uncharacterized membrane protein YidH (DUF202 family)